MWDKTKRKFLPSLSDKKERQKEKRKKDRKTERRKKERKKERKGKKAEVSPAIVGQNQAAVFSVVVGQSCRFSSRY